MTNEKMLERLYDLIKVCNDLNDFDSGMVDDTLSKRSAAELGTYTFRTPEMAFASLIADIKADIRKDNNKRVKGGTKKLSVLTDITKYARKGKPAECLIWYIHDYKDYQCACDGYRLVMLSVTDRIESEPIPATMKDQKPMDYESKFPVGGQKIDIDVSALRTAVKAKAPEWKVKRGKYDDKTMRVKLGKYGHYTAEWLIQMFDILGDDCEVYYHGELCPIEFRNSNGSKALLMPHNMRKVKLLTDNEIESLENENEKKIAIGVRNKYHAQTVDGTELVREAV